LSLPNLSYVTVTSKIGIVSEGDKMSGNFAEFITFYEESDSGAKQVHGHLET
jgi:hypothetical protein